MKDLFAPAGKSRRAGKLRLPIEPALTVRTLEERRVFHAGPLVPGPESHTEPAPPPPPPTTTVSLDGQQNLLIEEFGAGSHSDQLTIRFDQASQRYEIFDPTQHLHTEIEGAAGSGTHRLFIPYEVVGGDQLIVRTGAGEDSLTLDYSAGSSPLSIVFDGGEGTADTLNLIGGSVDSVRYQLAGADSAQIVLATGSQLQSIELVGVEPIRDELTAEVREFFVGGNVAHVSLSDDAVAEDGRSLIETSAGSSVLFVNPTELLRIDSTDASGATLSVSGLDQKLVADLELTTATSGRLEFSGSLNLHEGSLRALSGSIDVSGSIVAAGSVIDLRATSSLTVTATGLIASPSGQVLLDAGEDGTLRFAGRIDVSSASPGEHGGVVHLLGQRVALDGQASIDATGHSGGGRVLVGGDFQGQNPAIRRALETTMSAAASIDASATHLGHGGTIVLWADDAALIDGSHNLRARGGAFGGDGGLIETSGKRWLRVGGAADASAPEGAGGLWLLDPRNVRIVAGGSETLPASGTFDPSADNSEIDAAVIIAALEAGTNVTIITGNGGDQDGNIVVDQEIVVSAPGGQVTLTLHAANDIVINEAIRSENPAGADPGLVLNVHLHANSDAGGDNDDDNVNLGSVTIAADIVTNGGNLLTSGVDFTSTAGTITTGGGNLTLDHTGDVALGSTVALGGGNLTSGGASFTSTGAVSTSGGDITLNHTGGAVSIEGPLTLAGGSLTSSGTTFSNTGAITSSGSGTLTFTDAFPAAGATGVVNLTTTAAAIEISALAGGTAGGLVGNFVRVVFVAGAADSGTSAEYDAATRTITVSVEIGVSTVDDIVGEINDLAAFSATLDSGDGTDLVDAADVLTYTGLFSGGRDAVSGSDVITIAPLPGGSFTGTLTLLDDLVAPPGSVEATVDGNNNVTVRVRSSDTHTIADLAAAIQADLPQFVVTVTQTNGDGSYDVDTDSAVAAAFTQGGVTLNHTGAVTIGAGVTLAGGDLSSTGTTFNNTGGPISTAGGNVTLTHSDAVTIGSAVSLGGGSLLSDGSTTFTSTANITTTGGGNLTIDHLGAVSIGSAVSWGTGTFLSRGTTFDNTGGTFTASGGDATLEHTGAVTIASAVSLGGGSFLSEGTTFASTATLTTTGAGNITLDHSGNVSIGAAVSYGTGTLASSGTDFTNAGGTITATGGDVEVTHTGSVALAANISLGAGTADIETTGTDETIALSPGVTITAGEVLLTADGAITAGAGSLIDTSAASGPISLSGASLGASGSPLVILPGTGLVSLVATDGDIYVEIPTGDFETSQLDLLQADAVGALIWLNVAAGSLDIDSTAWFDGTNTTANDRFELSARGATSDIDFVGNVTLTAASVRLDADRDILGGSNTTADINTSAADGTIELIAGRNIGEVGNRLLVRADEGEVTLGSAATTGDIYVSSTGQLVLGPVTTSAAVVDQVVSISTLGLLNDLTLAASSTTNDDWRLSASGDLLVGDNVTITAQRFTQIQAVGAIESGGTATDDFVVLDPAVSLPLTGGSIGTEANPVKVNVPSGLLTLTANTGSMWVELSSGDLLLGSATITIPTPGATIGLSTTSGNITYDAPSLAGLASRNLYLRAGGAGNIDLGGETLTFASVTLLAGGSILGTAPGPGAAITSTVGGITLQSTGSIGIDAANRLIVDSAGPLSVTTTGPTGNIFIRSLGTLDLGNIAATDPGVQTIDIETVGNLTINGASGTNDNWFLTADDSIIFGPAGSIQANNVVLTATAGSITSSGAPSAVTLNPGGGVIGLIAATGIGSAINPLTLNPDDGVIYAVTSAGDVYLSVVGGDFETSRLIFLDSTGGAATLSLDVAAGSLLVDSTLDYSVQGHTLEFSASDNLAFDSGGVIRGSEISLTAGDRVLGDPGAAGNDVEVTAPGGQLTITAAGGIGERDNPVPALNDRLQVLLAAGAQVVAETTDPGAAIYLAAPSSILLGEFTTSDGPIDLLAAQIGDAGTPVLLDPGLGSLLLDATAGDVRATLIAGDLVASRVELLSAALAGATIELEAAAGNILLDDLTGFAANTADDVFLLTADGSIEFQSVTLVGAEVALVAGTTIESEGDAVSDIDTSAAGGNISLTATGSIGALAARLAVRAGTGQVTATTTATGGDVFLRGNGDLHLGTISTDAANEQAINILATADLFLEATSDTNDFWTLNAEGNIQFVGVTTIFAREVRATADGAILSGDGVDFNTSAFNGRIELLASSIGTAGNALDLLPGTGQLSLETTTGGIWIDIPTGSLHTTNIVDLDAQAAGQTVQIRTLDGSITIGPRPAGPENFNTADDFLFFIAVGSGSILSEVVAEPLVAAEIYLLTTGGIGSALAPITIAEGDLYTISSDDQHLAGLAALGPGIESPFVVRYASTPGTVLLERGWITLDGTFDADVLVTDDAELGGRGTIVRNLTVAAEGRLDPGLSDEGAGQLTIFGDLSLEANSEIFFDINPPYMTGGTDYDQLVVFGDVTIDNAILLLRGGQDLQTTIGGILLVDIQSGDADPGRFLVGDPSSVTEESPGVFEVNFGTFSGPFLYNGGDGNDIAIQELSLNPPIQQAAFVIPEFRLPVIVRPEPPPQTVEPPPPVPTRVDPPMVEADVETVKVRKIQVRLVSTIDDEGNVEEIVKMELDIEWLGNLKGILYLLPDDRYRIYLILEGGESRRVMDVVVRDGRPFEPEDVRAAISSRGSGIPLPATDVENPEHAPVPQGTPAPPPSGPADEGATPLPEGAGPALEPPGSADAGSAGASWHMLHAGVAVAAVVAARQARNPWEQQVAQVAHDLGSRSKLTSWRWWRKAPSASTPPTR
jgi:trimeric autotransporter adhesin